MDAGNVLKALHQANKVLHQAEQNFIAGNVLKALNLALKAKKLFPNLHSLASHLESYRIHSVFDSKSPDWYAVLNIKRGLDLELIRKRFKELRALTHPDKNTSSAADGAFKLVYKAWESIYKDLGNSSTRSKNNAEKQEEEEEERNIKCPDCSRQCVYMDSRRTVFECKNCNLMAMRGGKKEKEEFLMVVRDGFVSIEVKGELNTNINVCGEDTSHTLHNGLNNGVHVYGGARILLNRCKGVELKGGDSIHMNDCTQININGSGNLGFG